MTNGALLALLTLSLTACAAVPPRPAPISVAAVRGPSAQAVQDAADRIAARDRDVQAVIALNPNHQVEAQAADLRAANGTALGPLDGVPILIKDNVEVAGMPTTAGSLALAGNDTGRDAPIVTRLRRAGMIVLGKTNLSEWANFRSNESVSGWSGVGGQTRNPHALDRNPCGSSSGSGAAVAAGYTDFAIGTETNGSISCPAAMNGIVGFKPTVGLVSRTHIVPISATQDTAGPMTRTVFQAARLMNVIAGSDPADKATAEADARKVDYVAALDPAALRGKRFGLMRFAAVPGTEALLDQAVALLRAQGAEVVEIKELGATTKGVRPLLVLQAEFKDGLDRYLASLPPGARVRSLADVIAFNRATPAELALFDQDLLEASQATRGLDEPGYREALAAGLQFAGPDGIDRLLKANRVDALIGATMPLAWPIDPVNGDPNSGGGGGYLAAIAGYPHLTVPMGAVKGLPAGLSFLGAKWDDARILAMGHAYEQARGPLPRAAFLKSADDSAEVAAAMRPAARR